MRVTIDKFTRFVISGAATAGLFLILSYSLMVAGMSAFWSTFFAYTLAFLVGYTTQGNWTFGSRHPYAHSLPRYFALQGFCAIGSGLFAKSAINWFGLSPFVLSAITTGAAGLISFVVSSLWVFPAGRLAEEDRSSG